MGASPSNPWWRSILEWGQASDFREHFDIDWSAPKLLIPVLGQPYGQALGDGLFGLKLDERNGGISFTYYDNHLPLTPPSYARILTRIDREPFTELARRFAVAQPETAEVAKTELAALARDPEVRPLIDEAIAAIVATAVLPRVARGPGLARFVLARRAEGLTYAASSRSRTWSGYGSSGRVSSTSPCPPEGVGRW
jgi:(1->4)-alpha-D-glucan 1-alpha-D-glucosylmutase